MSDTSTVITDPERVRAALEEAPLPPVAQGFAAPGIDWLRAHVARFCDGQDHDRRRELVLAQLHQVSPAALRSRAREHTAEPLGHIRVLADCLGLSDVSPDDVAIAATAYLPPAPITATADRAVADLVAACGGMADETTAARIGLLVQACASTAALIANARRVGGEDTDGALARTLAQDPPVRRTCRIVGGAIAEIDLAAAGLPFGYGPHACPGREHALALAAGLLEGPQ